MDLITVTQASDIFGRSVQTINKMVRRGKFSEYERSGQRMLDLGELAEYYADRDEKRPASSITHSEYCHQSLEEFFGRLWEIEFNGRVVATIRACCYKYAEHIATTHVWIENQKTAKLVIWEVE